MRPSRVPIRVATGSSLAAITYGVSPAPPPPSDVRQNLGLPHLPEEAVHVEMNERYVHGVLEDPAGGRDAEELPLHHGRAAKPGGVATDEEEHRAERGVPEHRVLEDALH